MTNEVRVFLFPSGKSPDRQYRKKDGLNSASAKRLQNVHKTFVISTDTVQNILRVLILPIQYVTLFM